MIYLQQIRHRIQRTIPRNIIFGFFCIVLSSIPYFAFADVSKLYLYPESGTYPVGDVFVVEVRIESDGVAVNAAEADIYFNPDELIVESIDFGGSAFNLWPLEPSFSNTKGTITFAAAQRESFVAYDALVLSIRFMSRKSNTSRANIAAGAILAADGKATNILSALQSGVYTFEPQELLIDVEYNTKEDFLRSVIISSPTHPDENKWYTSDTALFNWDVSFDTESVRILADQIPASSPTVQYSFPLSTQTVDALTDGIWYFHMQQKSESGWSSVEHFRFQIDTTEPTRLSISLDEPFDTTNPKPIVLLDARDATSGIAVYEIQIDKNNPVFWYDESGRYTLPTLPFGEHTLFVKAIDNAGNNLSDSIEFTIDPIDTPTLLSYSNMVRLGEHIIVDGVAVPLSTVTVWLEHESGASTSHETTVDASGAFSASLSPVKKSGTYYLWLEARDLRDAESLPTDAVSIVVEYPNLASIFTSTVSFFGLFVFMLFGIGGVIGYLWYRIERKNT